MKYVVLSMLAMLLIACGEPVGKVIADIPEASGVDYCSDTKTLVVANDEGSYYELNTEGKILQTVKLGKYDLEGVVCEKERLIFAVEDKGLLILERKTGAVPRLLLPLSEDNKNPLFAKKAGVEGIAKAADTLYLAKQSKKKKDASIAVATLSPAGVQIGDTINHHLTDTAGLAYEDGYLYMVSDKEDLLVQFNLAKKDITKTIKLPQGAWEGIAFDEVGFVYLADDEGRVVKYTRKSLGL